MDLTLTPEQEMLAQTGRAFVQRSCPTERVRSILDRPLAFDPELWRTMAALGWAGLAIDEDHGGAGCGVLELAVLGESLGRGPVPSPLLATGALAARAIAAAGNGRQRRLWLPALASGEKVGTLALLEPGGADEWTPARMAGGRTLHGTKLLVPWAGVADVLVVSTASGLVLVDTRRGGVHIQRHDDLGADPLFVVELREAPAEPLGRADPERHHAVLGRVLDGAAAVALGFAVGAAERALELSLQHCRDRHQFGRPIGSFQAVAHRCVDMRSDLDACRLLAYRAAWAVDRGTTPDIEVASAKAYGNDALRRIFMHAHQVHGAFGFSTEHDLHLFTRLAKACELAYGTTNRHLERVATAMGLGSCS